MIEFQNDRRRSNLNISNHILPTSANLMGICFLIFSLVKTFGQSDETVLDELAVVGIYFFLTSAILSYFSLRTGRQSKVLERAADYVFMLGMLLLAVVSTIISFKIIL